MTILAGALFGPGCHRRKIAVAVDRLFSAQFAARQDEKGRAEHKDPAENDPDAGFRRIVVSHHLLR
jgi:hypothetical protein